MHFLAGHRSLIMTSLHMLEIIGSSLGGDLDKRFSDSMTLIIVI